MPVFAFLVGFGALAVWLGVLILPLLGFFALITLIAGLLGTPLNGALGIGIAVTMLPAIVYVPVVFFSFLLPALSQLLAHLVSGLFTRDGFTPKQAVELIALNRRKSLAVFGIAPRPKKAGG
ncbi:MAG: hypothetical protein KKH72_10025 [Alphaproteobacteria bacterium]|nr:hypothetical protein [Alphaproteobacteria bacterium]